MLLGRDVSCVWCMIGRRGKDGREGGRRWGFLGGGER